MSKKPTHVAIICIDEKYLLEFLDFKGGSIHRVQQPDKEWKPSEIQLVIEHRDLPDVIAGDELQRITPTYRYRPRGYSRIDPPKKPVRKSRAK